MLPCGPALRWPLQGPGQRSSSTPPPSSSSESCRPLPGRSTSSSHRYVIGGRGSRPFVPRLVGRLSIAQRVFVGLPRSVVEQGEQLSQRVCDGAFPATHGSARPRIDRCVRGENRPGEVLAMATVRLAEGKSHVRAIRALPASTHDPSVALRGSWRKSGRIRPGHGVGETTSSRRLSTSAAPVAPARQAPAR